jgi:hypothetical protein
VPDRAVGPGPRRRFHYANPEDAKGAWAAEYAASRARLEDSTKQSESKKQAGMLARSFAVSAVLVTILVQKTFSALRAAVQHIASASPVAMLGLALIALLIAMFGAWAGESLRVLHIGSRAREELWQWRRA